MENTNEVKLTLTEKLEVACVVIGTGLIVGGYFYSKGLKKGYKVQEREFENGIKRLWEANPGLQKIMWSAVKKPGTWIIDY